MNRIEISDLDKGDIVYECSQYGSNEMEVLTKPKLKDGQWTFKGRIHDETISYLSTVGLEHYGPRFYSLPVYSPVTNLDGSDSWPVTPPNLTGERE